MPRGAMGRWAIAFRGWPWPRCGIGGLVREIDGLDCRENLACKARAWNRWINLLAMIGRPAESVLEGFGGILNREGIVGLKIQKKRPAKGLYLAYSGPIESG